MNSRVTYRQQYTRCGKQRCRKCGEGEGHGPYWYAYWSENGRTVSKYIGVHLPASLEQGRTVVEGKAENSAHTAPEDTSSPVLRISLLGQFRVERRSESGWSVADPQLWQHHRARSLLGCLLSNGRRLSRERAMAFLWPDLEREVAANRLNGAVHELRRILEPDIVRPSSSRMLILKRDTLELAGGSQIWVDAEAFEQVLKEAETAPAEQAERLLEEAAALYRDGYLLEELYSEWPAQRREELQQKWIGLLLNLAKLRAERGAIAQAIEALDRLGVVNPLNEVAVQRLMLLLTQLHRRGEALQVYQQYVDILKREYESDPPAETRHLYNELLRGHIPAEYTVHVGKRNTGAAKEEGADVNIFSAAPQHPPPTPETVFPRPIFQVNRHHQYPFVGRDRELATMRDCMLTIERSPGEPVYDLSGEETQETASLTRPALAPPFGVQPSHFILLTGEAGIGKTRLAEVFGLEAYARGWAVVWSKVHEQEPGIPYSPYIGLLRTLLRSASPELFGNATAVSTSNSAFLSGLKLEKLGLLLPELVTPAPPLTTRTPPLPGKQEQLHVWEAMLELLITFSTTRPLLLVLDDLHEADDASIDLLAYLIYHLQEQRILLAGTCRERELIARQKLRTLITDLQRRQALVMLPLTPLKMPEIGMLVSHLPQNLAQRIQELAGGNPFFAEELVRQAERGFSFPESPLPEAITVLLEYSLSRLSGECQALLKKAASLGGSFELSQLPHVATEYTEDTIIDLLEEALQAGFLSEEGSGMHITYHFWHPLIIDYLRYRKA